MKIKLFSILILIVMGVGVYRISVVSTELLDWVVIVLNYARNFS